MRLPLTQNCPKYCMGKVSRIPTIGDYTIFFNSLFFVLYSEAKQMSDRQHHDHLKGDGVTFSKVLLKKGEKPGKFLLPHGMPSDDG